MKRTFKQSSSTLIDTNTKDDKIEEPRDEKLVEEQENTCFLNETMKSRAHNEESSSTPIDTRDIAPLFEKLVKEQEHTRFLNETMKEMIKNGGMWIEHLNNTIAEQKKQLEESKELAEAKERVIEQQRAGLEKAIDLMGTMVGKIVKDAGTDKFSGKFAALKSVADLQKKQIAVLQKKVDFYERQEERGE